MTNRLLAIALVLPLAVFAIACSSNDTKDSPSGPNAVGTPAPPASLAPIGTPAAPTSGQVPVGTPAAPSGPTIQAAFPFTDAALARISLLATAQFGPKMEPLDGGDPTDIKAYPGWLSAYPTLGLVAPLMNATPTTVSVYRGPLKTTEPVSDNNHKVIVFSVMDNKGGCAAGVIRGYPNYSEYKNVDITATPCNADSALAVLRR